MLKVNVLSTGSREGNSVILFNGETTLAIDFGTSSFKLWQERATEAQVDINKIDALLITHAHGDHVDCLNSYLKFKGNDTIYSTAAVLNDVGCVKKITRFNNLETNELKRDAWNEIGSFRVRPRRMQHDGLGSSKINECVGFEIYDEVNDKYYMYATDTGSFETIQVPEKGFDLIMAESNYDKDFVERTYLESSRDAAAHHRYIRTVKDHMSTIGLAMWLMDNNIKGCPVIELHESEDNKPAFKYKGLNKYNRTFDWQGETKDE